MPERNERADHPPVLLTDYQIPTSFDVLCAPNKISCEPALQEFDDIIYVPMQRKFWLINKETAQELEYSATTLFNNAKNFMGASEEEKRALMEKLDLSHLMKFYFNPDPIGFLTQTEQAAYADILAQYRRAKQELSGLPPYNDNPWRIQGALILQPERNYDHLVKQAEMENLSIRLDRFRRQGVVEAEKLGYVEDNGQIYTPEQIALKALIDRYIENRQIIADSEDTRHHSQTVFNRLADMQAVVNSEFLKEVFKHDSYYEATKRRLATLSAVVKEQTEIILQLGAMGIATPEFALGHYIDDLAEPFQHAEAVRRGIERVSELRVKQSERENILAELENNFSDWQFILASVGANVPPNAFIDNLKRVIDIDNQTEEKMSKAREICERFVPPKLFLSNPEAYHQPPSDAILQNIVPLREFTTPKWLPFKQIENTQNAKELYQFSLHDLAQASSTSAALFATKVADYLAGEEKIRLKDLNKNNEDTLLDAYFNDKGAIAVKLKADFFDDSGLFDAARLYEHLEKEEKVRVASLHSAEEKAQWGRLLKMIILKEDLLKRLMGFDAGYGAQFVRFLSKHTADYVPFLNYYADISAKTPSLTHLTLFGGDINLTASIYDGSVTSKAIYLPEVKNAFHPVLSFKHHQTRQPIELDFGYFFLKIYLKGWGFAGASMMLTTHVGLNAPDEQFALNTTQPALKPVSSQSPQLYLGGDLFAGVQAGITGTIECKWCPPKGTRGHFWQRIVAELQRLKGDDSVSGNMNTALDPNQESSYKTLCQMLIGGAVAAGVGVTAAFAITVHKDKIRLRIAFGAAKGVGFKGSFNLDIDPSAAIDIVRIVLQGIRKNDNRPIGWYSDQNEHLENLPEGNNEQSNIIVSEAFYTYATKLMLLSWSPGSMAFAFTVGISRLESLYKKLTIVYGVMAAHLANSKDADLLEEWFAELSPQAIGALLFHLTKDLKGNNSWQSQLWIGDSAKYTTGALIANQQTALANCVKWLLQRNGPEEHAYQAYPNTAQTIFAEAILRMNAEGINQQLDAYYNTAPDKLNSKQQFNRIADQIRYTDNIALIYQTMDRKVTEGNSGLTGKNLDVLQDKSRLARQRFNENFTQLLWHNQQGLFALNEFIRRRTERWRVLNGRESNNETSV